MTATSILPLHQRYVNGAPLSRRSFRPREKYVIILVVITFGLVCFGTIFYLPEFRGSNSTADSVYKVYDKIKRAGPELLIPPPPHLDEKEAQKLLRHDDDTQFDPHVIGDRQKLREKIEQDSELKVLERPDILPLQKTSSTASKSEIVNQLDENVGKEIDGAIIQDVSSIITVPPAPSNHYPDVNKGEDHDPVTRERRNKVKEVSHLNTNYFYTQLTSLDNVNLYAKPDMYD